MRRALELAEKGRYSVSPNPMVGCIIVRDGTILSEGWHQRAGEPHAEVEALRVAGDARGATMYVTLEPCTHQGRTPPCTAAVIASGVRRVVVAMRDPNERVDGQGLRELRAAGIDVEEGILESDARRLNEKFLFAVTHRRPFVLLKAGMTLDGKLATVARQSRWITSEEARERSLALREEYDAILVGSGTVKEDNPRLTRRLGLSPLPWRRVVVDASGDVPPHSQMFSDGGTTLLFTGVPANYEGVETIFQPAHDGRLDAEAVLAELYRRGIQSVIVEGGSLVLSDFLRRGLWQKMIIFVAPMVVGGAEAPSIFAGDAVDRLTEAYRFRFDRVEMVGSDLMLTAYPS